MVYSFNQFVEDLRKKTFELRAEPITEQEIKELLDRLLRESPEEGDREITDMETGTIIRIGDLKSKRITSREWVVFLKTILV
jgi:hypothetical protein